MTHQIELLRKHTSFKGQQRYYQDLAEPLNRHIELAIYLPEAVMANKHCSVIYYLPDIHASAHKTASQSDYQRYANRYDMIVVIPDIFGDYQGEVSERLARYQQEHNAITTYITEYLPSVIEHHFRAYETRSIMGFGFGATLALNLALTYPEQFRSLSLFSPWIGFSNTPWFNSLTPTPQTALDPITKLTQKTKKIIPTWIDIGADDQLLGKQIHIERLEHALSELPKAHQTYLNQRPHYDHSYYFVASHIREHFVFHADNHE